MPARPGRPAAASPRPRRRPAPLASAYATLGVGPKASDAEIKKAYRRLMSQHHPDKLMAKGLPEEAMRMASQKTQEIRRAYETITEARAA
jgi:DnaJ like chaperone protein